MCFFMHFGINLRVKYNLGDPPAVAQVNKNDAAMITTPENPAHEYDLLAKVVGAEFVTVMCALQRS